MAIKESETAKVSAQLMGKGTSSLGPGRLGIQNTNVLQMHYQEKSTRGRGGWHASRIPIVAFCSCPFLVQKPGSPFTTDVDWNIVLQPRRCMTLVAVRLLQKRIITRISADVHGPFFSGGKKKRNLQRILSGFL